MNQVDLCRNWLLAILNTLVLRSTFSPNLKKPPGHSLADKVSAHMLTRRLDCQHSLLKKHSGGHLSIALTVAATADTPPLL